MSLYDDLGVPKDADADTIKRAHRKRVKKTHPDSPSGNAEAFRKVQNAYLVLSDLERRKRYDETGDEGQTTSRSPEDAEADEARQQLGGMIAQLLNESDSSLDYTDMQKKLLGISQTATANMLRDKGKTNGQIARAEKMAKRWKFKKSAKVKNEVPDLIGAMLGAQIASLYQIIAQIERAERVNARVRAILDDYEYAFDTAPTNSPTAMQSLYEKIAREQLATFDPFSGPMFDKMNKR